MGASQLVEAELLLTLRLDALSALSALPEISLDKEFGAGRTLSNVAPNGVF